MGLASGAVPYLTKANRGVSNVVTVCSIGGSNCMGSATGVVAAPYDVKPANVNHRIQGVVQGSSFPNPHSIGPGFFYQLYTGFGWTGTLNWLQWAITTTDLAAWIATHGPNFLADLVSSGFANPSLIIHDWGGADAQDGAHLDASDDNQDTLYASFRRKLSGVAIYLPRLTTQVQGVYVKAGVSGVTGGSTWGLENEMQEYCDQRSAIMGSLDTRVAPYNSTSDLVHRLSASQVEVGRQVCREAWAAGIFA